jgi:hypothetical protein
MICKRFNTATISSKKQPYNIQTKAETHKHKPGKILSGESKQQDFIRVPNLQFSKVKSRL